MKLSLETRSPADARGDVLVVGRHGDPARPGPELAALEKKLGGLLSAVLKTERFEGKAGQMSHFHGEGRIAAGRVLVIGLGPRKPGDAEAAPLAPALPASTPAVGLVLNLTGVAATASIGAVTARTRAPAMPPAAGRKATRISASS